ncbi:MAG: class I SAM-dependent methyltransferase, partial [Clostridiales bacterium]|nr:class I SAM-dependent methyltransferase [Clostridiales bacterium]
SLYFAEKGHEVAALELVEENIGAFQQKIIPGMKISLCQGNALDLSVYEEESFDIVLLLGPLYHLEKKEDQLQGIREAKRVCKKTGMLFFAFINGDMVILTELQHRPNYFSEQTYDHDTFQVKNFPFVFHTVDQAREVLEQSDISVVHEVASDGVSELMAKEINELTEKDYQQYLRYHEYCCEKPEMLGRSNHLLFVGKKA